MHYGNPTKKLADEVLLRCSILEQLHSDQGVQFESQLMGKVCRLLHINQTRTTPQSPSMQRASRISQNLTQHVSHLCKWSPTLLGKTYKVCMVYNTVSVHQPAYNFFLMFGWHARLLIDTMHGAGEHDEAQSPCEYQYTEETPDTAFSLVSEQLATIH